jgi:hypothetical protein
VLTENENQLWVDYFSRIGFVQSHRKHIEDIQRLQDDSMHQLFIESTKHDRNEVMILKLKQDIRENVKLLSELGLGTPIVSAIKSKLEQIPKTN